MRWLCIAAWLWAVSAQAQDADDDGVPDEVEQPYGDSDGDGLANTHDADDDGDTRPTRVEGDGDTDRDGTPDYLDGDEDDDGLALLAEDVDGDGALTALDDTDRDGRIDALDADDDGDGVETRFELGEGDTDRDGRPNYRDPDDDGDGAATLDEGDGDADHDGIPAYLDADEVGKPRPEHDLDGDGIADDRDPDADGDGVLEERGDSDGDGIPDALDPDDDGDSVETARERGDTDGDGIQDSLDPDDDGDGIPTRDEEPDLNHDGVADDPRTTNVVPDYLSADEDNDGVSTQREGNADSDGDGIPDARDADDDGDGVGTNWEAPDGVDRDTDADGLPDRLDADDDDDTLPTRLECTLVFSQDVDGDGAWNCYDLDADGDGASDAMEGTLDTDEDGIPDFLDATATPKDSDHDGIPDVRECELPMLGCPDVDGDGIPDYLDPDDDGDGTPTANEPGGRDDDGVPDYLDPQQTMDAGVVTRARRDEGCSLGAASGGWWLIVALLLLRRRAALLLLVACGEDEPARASFDLDAQVQIVDARVPEQDASPACMNTMLQFATGDTAARAFSATIEGNRVQLVYVAPSCGGATSLGQGKGLRRVHFNSAGVADEPMQVEDEDCLPLREPTLVADAIYFGSARDGQFDLYTQAQRVTANAALELEPIAALGGVAFVSQDALPSTEPASIQLWLGGATRELLPVRAGHHPVQLAARDALLAWRSDRAETAGLYVLSATGVQTITTQVGDRSSLAFVDQAMVYTELLSGKHVLRYRLPSGEARPLTASDQDVLQLAAARYRTGYAVAYRNREADGTHTLRLLSLDAQGNVAANTTLARARGDGTHVQLLTAVDGRLLVLWDEPGPDPVDGGLPDFNRTLHVGRVSCL